MLKIRDASINDIDTIMKIYINAQNYMINSGNPTQWGHFYPTIGMIEKDIKSGLSKVIYDEDGIHGVFALLEDEEPTYQKIEGGNWLNNEPYVTLHRLSGDGVTHGIFKCASDYCKSVSANVRIDTHADNKTMQRLILENDFILCGIIHVEDGTERIAYQWSR